jgi:hypothetical protein
VLTNELGLLEYFEKKENLVGVTLDPLEKDLHHNVSA